MKKNLPVTQVNHDYSEDIRIVSTTTYKGVINYANEDFEKVSGFSKDELLGQAHNIVRHPDMPQAAFQDLWDTIYAGKPWMGVVKNRCKNGDHYWVNAFVMGSGNETKGKPDFQSVRFKPEAEQIERAEKTYHRINYGRPPLQTWLPRHWSLNTKCVLVGVAALLPPLVYFLSQGTTSVGAIAAILCGLFFSTLLASWIGAPYRAAAAKARNEYDNPLAQYIFSGSNDELGALKMSNLFLNGKLETAMWRVVDASDTLEKSAERSAEMAKETESETHHQRSELEQLATAINEMSCSISEVSDNTANASELMESVQCRVQEGSNRVNTTTEFIGDLVENLQQAASQVQQISNSSESISGLVQSIHGIAEQTNLLALNAAIEAARAGEQGRGFAVVADEVRNLANSTAETTDQIQTAIQGILEGVDAAVKLVDTTVENSNQTVEQSELAGASLQEITQLTQRTLDAMIQSASATEQQSAVCEEINQNVHRIQSSAMNTCQHAQDAQQEQQALLNEVRRLTTMAKDFAKH